MKSDQASSDRYQELERSGRAHCSAPVNSASGSFANVDRHKRALLLNLDWTRAAMGVD